jgi:hypothetical protein
MENKPCKIWVGAKNRKGYGQKRIKGKLWIVSRLEYTRAHGEIPSGVCVLHRCDNPSCWEISHLFLGTHQDNADDKMKKNRHTTKNRVHCKFGHTFSEQNTRTRPDGARQCRICERECMRKNYDPAKRHARYLAKKKGGQDGNLSRSANPA